MMMGQFECWHCASGAKLLVTRDSTRYDHAWGYWRLLRRIQPANEE